MKRTFSSTQGNREVDVIVIGGGPAGSTAAALLGMRGHRVLLLEKEKFPRYHIGESLMPYCYFTLERLGVIDQIKASNFPRKYSVQFVTTEGKVSQPFYFFQHLDHEASTTWQVMRSEFDQILLNNARAKGVEVIEETLVNRIVKSNEDVEGVEAIDKSGKKYKFIAPITLDATGRDGVSMTQNRWRMRDPILNKISIWTYFKGGQRDQGLDYGATTVAYLPDKGWFWYIPLSGDLVSVGIVADKKYLYRGDKELAKIFFREIPNNPWIENHLKGSQQVGQYWVTGEYSYRSKFCASNGLLLVGDAYAFLDPVFSSGVFLALRSGELAADAVHRALSIGDCSAKQFLDYSREMIQGIESMRKLVYAFYNHEFSFRGFVQRFPELRGDLTDCLIGNLFQNMEPLFKGVSEFAQLPKPVSYGQPQVEL